MAVISARISILDYLNEVSTMLGAVSIFDIHRAVELLQEAGKRGSRIWIVGNGGSAATAAHFANDLCKAALLDARALVNDIPLITAYGNDDGWENMFSHILDVAFKEDDVLVAISYSGRSRNVINAGLSALKRKGHLIILTGEKKENPLSSLPACAIITVNTDNIRVAEDCHMAICHAITGELRHHEAK